jgi:hypothetical protein
LRRLPAPAGKCRNSREHNPTACRARAPTRHSHHSVTRRCGLSFRRFVSGFAVGMTAGINIFPLKNGWVNPPAPRRNAFNSGVYDITAS